MVGELDWLHVEGKTALTRAGDASPDDAHSFLTVRAR